MKVCQGMPLIIVPNSFTILLLPAKSLVLKLEKSAPGFKGSKDRVTVLASSNATGEHKLTLCFIGQAKKPCAFKPVLLLKTCQYDKKSTKCVNEWGNF